MPVLDDSRAQGSGSALAPIEPRPLPASRRNPTLQRRAGGPTGSAVIEHSAPTWGQARAAAHRVPRQLPPKRVTLAAASGLTLASRLLALTPLPAFDTAAMDGYAVCGSSPYQLRGTIATGDQPTRTLTRGEAFAITTGAPVPPGCDAVLPYEHTRTAGLLVVRDHDTFAQARSHIRRSGEDAAEGAVLAAVGSPITPALLGLAAACGYDELSVCPSPRVHLLVTGDELLPSGRSGAGRTRDALTPAISALIDQFGAALIAATRVDDAVGALADSLAVTAEEPDVITVVTGSTSVGTNDRLRAVLRERGARYVVDGVRCRPGHPQLLAELSNGHWVVGLPGNPFAAFVAAYTVLAPLITGLAGRPLRPLPSLPIVGEVRPADGETRLVPVVWEGDMARVLTDGRAASLHGAALCDGIAALPPGWEAGRRAPVLPVL